MCGSMADIQSTAAEIRRGKKKKDRNHRMKIYMVSLLHRATIIRRNVYFGPKQHSCTLKGVQIAPSEGTIFRGKDIPWHARRRSAVSCAKMAEKIEMLFRLLTRVGLRKDVLGGLDTCATWRIRMNRSCASAMPPFCQITLTTCYYCY